MKHLDKIQHPRDLRKLSTEQLKELAGEVRQRIIEVVGTNGGHLASNLGVTEITIALHYCFDFEKDHLLLDVGHQCYPHKLLTGRQTRFDSLRKAGGISGFPEPAESPFDPFKVGHAGTSIATAVGLAQADQVLGRDCRTVALVGDASIVNGLAFEGLNQAGLLKRQMLVILNDNNWGISRSRGALAEYLAKFRISSLYEEVKQRAQQVLPRVPIVGKPMFDMLNHLKEGIKATVSPHQVFENMGFVYFGPVNGHDIGHLIQLLQALRDVNHPVLLHIHTNKGQGADFAKQDPDGFHSPHPFRIEAGKVRLQKGSGRSWTQAFAEALIELARQDRRIVALTAGMPAGTGLDKFAEAFPDRYRDIGIAESATVDIAGGMAKAGLRPVVAIYSTFMQRAFDQIFQEVVLQGLPVVFCLDRAGLVGGDGAVHHGFLDIAYLRSLPNMVLAAPADEDELKAVLRFALQHNGPVAIRYPRADVPEFLGQAPRVEAARPSLPSGLSPSGRGPRDRDLRVEDATEALGIETPPFVPGESRLMQPGRDATILAYGSTVSDAIDAAELLATDHISVRVINARFAKPVDRQMLQTVLGADHPVITVEDHSVVGGFGSAVLEAAADMRLPTERIVRLGLPADRFIAQGSRAGQLAECGIDAAGIAAAVQRELERLHLDRLGQIPDAAAARIASITPSITPARPANA